MFSCGRIAQAASPPLVQSITVQQAVTFCAKAFADFKKTRNTRFFEEGMKLLDPRLYKSVALVCAGYGVGYEDGTKWKGKLA